VREGSDPAGLALSGVARVEIHTDEANAISAAIPRRLGYRLDRVDELPPEAPAHSGRLQIWVTERPCRLERARPGSIGFGHD
jgi:RimJ/RimL family protein N-acetyltransferase